MQIVISSFSDGVTVYSTIFIIPSILSFVFLWLIIFKNLLFKETLTLNKSLETKLFILSVFAIFFFTFGLLYSYLSDNSFRYTIGDFYRSILPFFIYTVLYYEFFLTKNSFLKFSKQLIGIYVLIAILGATMKSIYVSSGQFYGGGMHQYYMSTLIYVLLVLKIFFYNVRDWLTWRKLKYVLMLLLLIILSILSMKRGVWISLIFSTFILFMIPLGSRINKFALALIYLTSTLLFFLLIGSDTISLFIQRVIGFFNDGSLSGRLIEIESVLKTFSNDAGLLNWLFGFGHGAELTLIDKGHQWSGLLTNETHHIHSIYFLMLYRNGLFGLFFYIVLFIIVFIVFIRYLRDVYYFHSMQEKPEISWLIGFACAFEIFIDTIHSIQGNTAYGSSYYTLVLFVALYMRTHLKQKNIISNS